MHLVKLVVAWEEWEESKYFKEHTSNAPVVHFVVVVTIS
jgi:hypothetical protein